MLVPRMRSLIKWILAFACLPVAAFCVFGFLATFEPGVQHAWAFRVTYALIGTVSLAVPVVVAVRALHARQRGTTADRNGESE